jgi:hypothetical protein
LLEEFRGHGEPADFTLSAEEESKRKQNGTKTTFFPSVTRARFPLQKARITSIAKKIA